MSSGFKHLEHTGDVGIRIWAKTRRGLFEEAARGMVSIILSAEETDIHNEILVHLEAPSIEELLLAWLKEVLFLIENENVVYRQFQVENTNFDQKDAVTYYMDAKLAGTPFSKLGHNVCREIKAVTRHAFYLKQNGPWWEASVLFDV